MLLLFIYFVEFNSLGLLVCNEFIYYYEILFFIGRSGFVVELVGLSMFVLIWLEKLVVQKVYFYDEVFVIKNGRLYVFVYNLFKSVLYVQMNIDIKFCIKY